MHFLFVSSLKKNLTLKFIYIYLRRFKIIKVLNRYLVLYIWRHDKLLKDKLLKDKLLKDKLLKDKLLKRQTPERQTPDETNSRK